MGTALFSNHYCQNNPAVRNEGKIMKTNMKNKKGDLRCLQVNIPQGNCIIPAVMRIHIVWLPFSLFLLFSFFIFTSPGKAASKESDRIYKVAIDKEFAPYEFLNDKNTADGFTPSLLHEIGKSAGVTFEFVPLTWPSAIKALENGEVDIINMIRTQERASIYYFSGSHSKITQALFRNSKVKGIENIASLSEHVVGFQGNDISLIELADRNDFKLRIYDSKVDGLLDLNIGKIDAFLCAEQVGIRLISKYNFTNIKLVEGGLFSQDFAFATRKENRQLIELLNTSLASLKKSGKLKTIKDEWLSGRLITPGWFEENQFYLLLLGGVLSLSLIFLLFLNRALQHKVSEKTKVIRASEERFRQLAENIDEVFWMTTPEKNQMLYVSPSYEKIWGRSCQSLYNEAKSWTEAIHPEDRDHILKAAITRQANASYDETFRIVKPDGSVRWIRDRAFPVEDASGKVYRIAGIAQDITDQRNFEDELNDRKNKIQSLLRISRGLEKTSSYAELLDIIYNEIVETTGIPSVWIYLFDEPLETATFIGAKGNIASILNNGAPILHIKGDPFLEEIATATHTVIVEDATTDPRTDKKIVGFLGNRTIINVPIILVEHHIGSVGMGTFGEEGFRSLTTAEADYLTSIGSHVASAIDRIQFISELKNIQEELIEKEEKYRGLSEAAFESIFISENGICIEQNQMAEKMFGYSCEEAVGRQRVEWFVPEERERVMKYIMELYQEPYEAVALKKDGSTFPCMVCGKMMHYKGKNVRVTSVTDITERKLAEEKIFQQLAELQRWQSVTLEREDRMIELKQEVNSVLEQLGKPKKYLST